jgi:hypothetical protein
LLQCSYKSWWPRSSVKYALSRMRAESSTVSSAKCLLQLFWQTWSVKFRNHIRFGSLNWRHDYK